VALVMNVELEEGLGRWTCALTTSPRSKAARSPLAGIAHH
jgi:hypothetical protein